MSVQTRSPLRVTGATLSSGFPGTQEVLINRGGTQTATIYSGAIAMGTAAAGTGAIASGGSILIFSGAGRLNTVTPLFPAGVALAGNGESAIGSGQPFVIYDSAITARSGVFTDATIAESGRKILFSWMPPRALLSGATWPQNNFLPIPLDTPFQSGLCVMALSGCVGLTLQYTPEVAPANPIA